MPTVFTLFTDSGELLKTSKPYQAYIRQCSRDELQCENTVRFSFFALGQLHRVLQSHKVRTTSFCKLINVTYLCVNWIFQTALFHYNFIFLFQYVSCRQLEDLQNWRQMGVSNCDK